MMIDLFISFDITDPDNKDLIRDITVNFIYRSTIKDLKFYIFFLLLILMYISILLFLILYFKKYITNLDQ